MTNIYNVDNLNTAGETCGMLCPGCWTDGKKTEMMVGVLLSELQCGSLVSLECFLHPMSPMLAPRWVALTGPIL